MAGASAFGWMLAYLRGPDTVAELHRRLRRHRPAMIMFLLVVLFVIVGDFIDAVPAIIIFMPIINKLTELGNINPVHMGVVIITTLVFGLITPPYGLSLLVASKFVGVPFYRAMFRSLPLYVVFLVTIAFTVLFPDVVLWLPKQFLPQSVGCFRNPSGSGLHLPVAFGEVPETGAAPGRRLQLPHRDRGLRQRYRIGTRLATAGVRRRQSTNHQEATMGKRTGQRVRAKATDLSSATDRTTKIRGGGVAGQGTTAPRPRLVSITDGTSNTITFGEVVRRRP